MQNLRDKLMKAGLVTEDQAKKAETTAPAPRRSPQQAPRDEGAPPPRRDDNRPPRREDTRPQRRDEGRPPHGRAASGGGRPAPQGGRPGPGGGRPPFGGGRPAPGGRPAAPQAEKSIPKLPPLPGSKAYQRAESKKQMELDRALRELVLGAQIPQEAGETTFYFMTRKGKLRRLELSVAQAKALEDGALAVVERPEPAQIEHSLVPAATAEQMHALSPKSVRFFNRKENPVGFMTDDQLKAQQAAEAAGTAPEVPDEEEAGGEEQAAEQAPESAQAAPEGGTEPKAE